MGGGREGGRREGGRDGGREGGGREGRRERGMDYTSKEYREVTSKSYMYMYMYLPIPPHSINNAHMYVHACEHVHVHTYILYIQMYMYRHVAYASTCWALPGQVWKRPSLVPRCVQSQGTRLEMPSGRLQYVPFIVVVSGG